CSGLCSATCSAPCSASCSGLCSAVCSGLCSATCSALCSAACSGLSEALSSGLGAVSAGNCTSSNSFSLVLIISDMVESTSFIISAGVEAPAVIPTVLTPLSIDGSSSSALSINMVGQCSEHTFLSFSVLELSRPPIITIISLFLAILTASLCILAV